MEKDKNKENVTGQKPKKGMNRREFIKTGTALTAGAGLTILSPKWSFGTETKGPINLGFMSSLSGLMSAYGEQVIQAAEITLDQINEEGGVLGRKVKMIFQDDHSELKYGLQAAERLVKKYNCAMISGHYFSNVRIAVSQQVSEPHKVVMNNYVYDEGAICGRYYFQMAGVANQNIDPLVEYLAENRGKRWYFSGGNYEWGQGSIAQAKETLKKLGGESVGTDIVPMGTKEFSSILGRIKKAKPDVVAIFQAGSDQYAFMKQFAAAGLNKKIALCSTFYDELFRANLEPAVREGFYACGTYYDVVPSKESEMFMASLRKKYGEKGDLKAATAAASIVTCICIWAQAVEKAGTTNSDEVVKAQEGGPGEKYGLSWVGPQGKVTIVKDSHYSVQPAHLIQSQPDGSHKLIKSWSAIEPVIPERYGGCKASAQFGCRPLKTDCPPFPS